MIRATIAAAFCAGLAAGGCGSAFAEDCAGNVFSHETFDAQPSGWTSNPQVKVEDGRLQMMPNAGQSLSIPVAVPDQGAFEACVTANLAAGSGGQVSFVVSMPRHNSEVFFTLDSKGTVNIRRHDTATGKWTSVDEAGGDPAVKTGIGGTNRLRVEIDEFATLYVNDSPLPLASALDEVAGAPLQLRLQIDADKRGPSIWLIDDVVISTADATAGATASTSHQSAGQHSGIPSTCSVLSTCSVPFTCSRHRGLQRRSDLPRELRSSAGRLETRLRNSTQSTASFRSTSRREASWRFRSMSATPRNTTCA